MNNQRWRLPDGVEELLPASARRLESLRRQLVDLFESWGYDQVNPPLIEYLDSLLTGTGETLDLQTFKFVDQLNGRMLGVRADMTPQVARIDAHQLRHEGVTRLFYMGSVLRTLPDGPGGSRCPLQLGTEIYGHAGDDSDIETIQLMLQTLSVAGVVDSVLDLGHVGVFRALVENCELSPAGQTALESRLFEQLQRKSLPDIQQTFEEHALPRVQREQFEALLSLSGGVDVINQARELLGDIAGVAKALDSLAVIASAVERRSPSSVIGIDLAELRGYSYHTGVVYSVYSAAYRRELARGGRYDDIGEAFGRARPATGFSTDLRQLVRISLANSPDLTPSGILVSRQDVDDAWASIETLRNNGERVVVGLTDDASEITESGCDRRLVREDGRWQVQPLPTT